MKNKRIVKLVSISFNEHSGLGIIEYGVRLAKALQKQKSDLDFYMYPLVKGNVFMTPRRQCTPIRVRKLVESPDVIHYLDPGFIIRDVILGRRKLLSSKFIVTVHDLDMFRGTNETIRIMRQYTNPLAFIKKPLLIIGTPLSLVIRHFATKFVINHASKFICASENTRDELSKRFKIDKNKCVVVYPIVSEHFRRIRTRKTKRKIIIGHLSSYLPNKNARILIDAFKKTTNKNLELHLYGGTLPFKVGDDKRIKYFGFVPTEKIPRVLSSFDVFVFPSIWEGFGMPVMEAKKCGVPVITYAKGALPDVVKRHTLQFKDEADLTRMLENIGWKKINTKKAILDAKACDENDIARKMIKIYKNVIARNN